MRIRQNIAIRQYHTCSKSIESESYSANFSFLLTLLAFMMAGQELPASPAGTRTSPRTKAKRRIRTSNNRTENTFGTGQEEKKRLQQHMQKQWLVVEVPSQKQPACRRSRKQLPACRDPKDKNTNEVDPVKIVTKPPKKALFLLCVGS